MEKRIDAGGSDTRALTTRASVEDLTPAEASLYPRERAKEPSVLELLTILVRHRKTILCFVAGALLVGALYWLLAPRYYTAEATVEIGGHGFSVTDSRLEDMLRQETKEEKYHDTQVAKLRSLSLADYVLEEKKLAPRIERYASEDRGWTSHVTDAIGRLFAAENPPAVTDGPYHFDEGFLRTYLSFLQVAPLFGTSLVNVSSSAKDPILARDLVNNHVEGFMEFMRDERRARMNEASRFLQGQADHLREEVAAAERNLAGYAEENKLLTLGDKESVVVKEIEELTRLLSRTTEQRIEAESKLTSLRGARVEESTVLDDESLRQMRADLLKAEAKHADMSRQVMPAYPPLQQLTARIASLQTGIAKQRRLALAALTSRFESARRAETSLREQVDTKKQEAFKDSRRLVRYNILRREYSSLKDLYQSILQHLQEAQVNASSTSSNVNVAALAATPLAPSSPRAAFVAVIAACFGAALGIGFTAFRILADRTLQQPEDVTRELRSPLLGVVPKFEEQPAHQERSKPVLRNVRRLLPGSGRAAPPPGSREPCVTLHLPAAAASEAYRAVRTNLLLSPKGRDARVMLVTSASKEEGKTTLAANLGVTLAQFGFRTLLLDADLRRGDLGQRFQSTPEHITLLDCLAHGIPWERAHFYSPLEHLDVLPAGNAPTNPTEILGSPCMRRAVQELQHRYEYIILDSPPVLPVADALILSQLAEGVLFVVRSGTTETPAARTALDRLSHVQAPLLGVVINAFDFEANRHYARYHDYSARGAAAGQGAYQQ